MNVEGKIVEFAKQFGPLSVFLYGSQATGETTSHSDWEVGLVFEDDKYVSRGDIKSKQDFDGANIYPFRLSEMKNYTLDTPFPKKFFVYELMKTGKTIYGEDIMSQIEVPKITKLDLAGAIRFEIGEAFCSFLTMRRGDEFLTGDEFSKSCLHGLKVLVAARDGVLLTTYREIYDYSKDFELAEEYREIVEAAYGLRQGKEKIDESLVYKNMSFLGFVEKEILAMEKE